MSRISRVLYVNQTGQIGGAERLLIDLLDALRDRVEPVVACPEGELAHELSRRSVVVRALPEAKFSFRLHPIHTARGVAWITIVGLRLARLARALGVDLVHANSARSGLASWAIGVGRTPVLVHMHDWFPSGMPASVTLASIDRIADLTVANSQFVAGQMSGKNGPVVVTHNPVDESRFDPDLLSQARARATLGLAEEDEILAVIAYFTPWKGQDDAVRALAILKEIRPRARLLLVGSAKFTEPGTRYDNSAFLRHVQALVREHGLDDDVLFLGDRDDVPVVLAASDVLLVPSWKEAFGLTMLEGMSMRIPVIATRNGGPAEVIHDGEDGLLLEPRQPELWARTIAGLLGDVDRREVIGTAARRRVISEFGLSEYADQMLSLYMSLCSGKPVAGHGSG